MDMLLMLARFTSVRLQGELVAMFDEQLCTKCMVLQCITKLPKWHSSTLRDIVCLSLLH